MVPVWCVTPEMHPVIHRFFDTSPISPSGRYLALTRFPYDDRMPAPGDAATVVLVDLTTGDTRDLARTCAWDTQLRAQVQWGASDEELVFNDLDPSNWEPFATVLNPLSGTRRNLPAPVYMMSPDGRLALSPCLRRIRCVQAGYGVIVPPNETTSADRRDDGITLVDVGCGTAKTLITTKECLDAIQYDIEPEEWECGAFYWFHVKWNGAGDRLMLILRWVPPQPRHRLRDWLRRRQSGWRQRQTPNHMVKNRIITTDADGSNVRLALSAKDWQRGGHHPTWHPDGEHITMNLRLSGSMKRFVCFRYDGEHLRPICGNACGSGHPSIHASGKFMLTDAYPRENPAYADGTVPLRWVDVQTGAETELVRIATVPRFSGPKDAFRLDPHPAWDRSKRYVTFNGCVAGLRRVFIADLNSML